ncbi:MAG: hypothetical protein VX346_24445 [Planctomycetota bacterium]|nr:hypothetical protein [Planctomycetota bacterium]
MFATFSIFLIALLMGFPFSLFAALVFTGLHYIGKAIDVGPFEVFAYYSEPHWGFWDYYKRYIVVALVYTYTGLPLSGFEPVLGILALPLMILAVKKTFDANWVMAFVVGVIGGFAVLVCSVAVAIVMVQVLVLAF